jgi:hypothetical protein
MRDAKKIVRDKFLAMLMLSRVEAQYGGEVRDQDKQVSQEP